MVLGNPNHPLTCGNEVWSERVRLFPALPRGVGYYARSPFSFHEVIASGDSGCAVELYGPSIGANPALAPFASSGQFRRFATVDLWTPLSGGTNAIGTQRPAPRIQRDTFTLDAASTTTGVTLVNGADAEDILDDRTVDSYIEWGTLGSGSVTCKFNTNGALDGRRILALGLEWKAQRIAPSQAVRDDPSPLAEYLAFTLTETGGPTSKLLGGPYVDESAQAHYHDWIIGEYDYTTQRDVGAGLSLGATPQAFTPWFPYITDQFDSGGTHQISVVADGDPDSRGYRVRLYELRLVAYSVPETRLGAIGFGMANQTIGLVGASNVEWGEAALIEELFTGVTSTTAPAISGTIVSAAAWAKNAATRPPRMG